MMISDSGLLFWATLYKYTGFKGYLNADF